MMPTHISRNAHTGVLLAYAAC